MPYAFVPSVHDRLIHLAETLKLLKERVREAVATEMGRVIADAVRDVLTAALRHRPVETRDAAGSSAYRRAGSDPWSDDDPDPWDRDRTSYSARDREERAYRMVPAETAPAAPRSGWTKAASISASVVKWLLTHRLPLGSCLGLGAVVGVVSVFGGPLARALLAALATAADLFGVTQPLGFPLLI